MDIQQINNRVQRCLDEYCLDQDYSIRDLCRDSLECRNGLFRDALRSGSGPAAPFFNFVALAGTAIVTTWNEASLDIYFVRCEEARFRLETSDLALSEPERIVELLRTAYDKHEPDLSIQRGTSDLWLEAMSG
jgi:hypothetical protein